MERKRSFKIVRFFLFFGLGFLVCFSIVNAVAGVFFKSINDLPLAPGLLEARQEGLVYRGEYGNIITAVAYGEVKIVNLRKFYERVLPSLGWNLIEEGKYIRDGELLVITFKKKSDRTALFLKIVTVDAD